MGDWNKPTRVLNIKATPHLIWNADGSIGATLSYEQTGSAPNMPNVVNPGTGDINIRHMPRNPDYGDMISIVVELDDTKFCDANGNQIAGRFAKSGEGDIEGTGAVWLCSIPPKGQEKDLTPIQVLMMVLSRQNDTMVTIMDGTAEGSPDYAFCLGLVLPAHDNYFITIDPVISSRGVGQGN